MACKRSAVRSRLAPPRFALRATRGAAAQSPKDGAWCPRRSPTGEDGLSGCSAGKALMWYVYIIRSINFREQEYIGATEDLKRRIPEHNAGRSAHTARFKPWKLVWYCAFPDTYKALEFEKYLKSRSGRAFARKRF